MTFSTYLKYIFYAKRNRVVFWVCIVFFLLTEGCNTAYFRILANYDNMIDGKYEAFKSDRIFWMTLGLIQLGYFTFMTVKYFLLNLTALNSNQLIHEDMIHGLVRSPCSYFDTTPSGRLNNKFSNDLGILDNNLVFVLTDSLEGPIICIALILNVFQINLLFLPLGFLNIIFIVCYYRYCKKMIIAAKQLDLRMKSPVFNMVSEMISGLIQIRVFKQRGRLLAEFAHKVNESLRANLCFWILSRAFGAFVNYLAIIVMTVGWMIGIIEVSPENAGLYAVSVVFLIQISDYLQWFLRQLVVLESLMVSVERSF